MTDPYARPADDGGDATIPIVPEAGYAPTEQLPFAEETLVDPVGPGSLWSADSGLDLSAPGYGRTSATQAPAQPTPPPPVDYPQASTPPAAYPPPSGYPTPAAYTRTSYTQPTTNYTQPTAAYGQSGYGQPVPQTNHVQPQVAPSQPAPYRAAPIQGFAEPSGPADTIGAQSIYQGYPTAPGAPAPQQAWPAVIQDPVAYDYGYSNPANLSEHPNATLSMVLGIIGLVFFQLLSPVAWYLAAKGRREMAMSPGRWRPSGSLTAGFVLGIIGTVFLALGAMFILVFIGIIASTGGG
jgi:hypothetical protein